jgi:ABC-type dipeptide/oligopeptide/nickel transport system permease component
MSRFLLISTARACLTLVGVSVLIFSLARLSGSPVDAMLPDAASATDRARITALWGLDKPIAEQYLVFVSTPFMVTSVRPSSGPARVQYASFWSACPIHCSSPCWGWS